MPKPAVSAERIGQLTNVDLVSISHALLVAECLSFRRAAAILGIRQSAVSRRVRALEDALGVSLFERNHAGVRVTSAGAHFFDQARNALFQIDGAVKAAGAAGRGTIGRINIGILSSMGAGFLRELIRIYRERHPDVAMHVLEGASAEQLALLEERKLDVAFVLGNPFLPKCEVGQFWNERIYVALPRSHPLCEGDEASWGALRGEQFILCQSEKGRALHDELIKRLAALDHRPNVRRLDVGRETLMHLVALRLGLSLTSEAAVATQFPEVAFRPIAGDDAQVAFSAVWLPTNDNPAFRRFLSVARSTAKQWKDATQLA